MNIHLENVNLGSNSGPNSFALKLFKYGSLAGHSFDDSKKADASLCFIQSFKQHHTAPLVQRLDGLYFNTTQDWQLQNSNILKTYQRSDGVVFQSDFKQTSSEDILNLTLKTKNLQAGSIIDLHDG